MSWKYIILQVGDRQVPIIFPSDLVHSYVAGAMQLVVEAHDPKKDLRPKQLEGFLEKGVAPVVGAGFLEGMACAIAMGESETLGVNSRDEDTRIINNHPYEKGMGGIMSELTEKLILTKTCELLLLRIKEIEGD